MDQGGIGLHAGAFKKLVHFFHNSFFPMTKCDTKVSHAVIHDVTNRLGSLWRQITHCMSLVGRAFKFCDAKLVNCDVLSSNAEKIYCLVI